MAQRKYTSQQMNETAATFTAKARALKGLSDDLQATVDGLFNTNQNEWMEAFQPTWYGRVRVWMDDVEQYFSKYGQTLDQLREEADQRFKNNASAAG